MSAHRKLGAVLVTAIAMGSLFVGGMASAHFADSSISLNVDDKKVKGDEKVLFFGKLKNPHQKCKGAEKVELVRKHSGVVATDMTDSDGEFSFNHDPKPNHGRYFARYDGKGKFGYGNKHRCSSARSDTVRIRRDK